MFRSVCVRQFSMDWSIAAKTSGRTPSKVSMALHTRATVHVVYCGCAMCVHRCVHAFERHLGMIELALLDRNGALCPLQAFMQARRTGMVCSSMLSTQAFCRALSSMQHANLLRFGRASRQGRPTCMHGAASEQFRAKPSGQRYIAEALHLQAIASSRLFCTGTLHALSQPAFLRDARRTGGYFSSKSYDARHGSSGGRRTRR